MSKDDYPRLWQLGLIQEKVRLRANHRCEQCGMAFQPGTNLAVSATNRNGNPTIGTVHHIDLNKQNCSKRNLVYLCQRCHYMVHLLAWMPGKHLPKRWIDNIPQWIVARDLPYIPSKQLALPLFGGAS